MSTAEFTPAPPTPTSPACPVIVPAHLLALRSAKVRDHHLDRKAIVYIRQSSPQQVAEHKESTARQYALADVAVALGWPRDRVEIVDADQGRTGQTVEGRLGFQYILAELSLDHVGIVLGLDASRLARSDPDWAPLVRSCGLFRALLGDYDGLYDPTDFNDRLLLGLKGIMSEAELHFLRVPDERGATEQGPPRRAVQPRADRLCARARPRAGPRPRRAGSAGGAARLRPIRSPRELARVATLPGPSRDPPAGSASLRAQSGEAGVASSQSGDTPKYVASSGLCRLLPSRAPRPRPAAEGARPARDGADDQQAGGLLGAAGGPLPGLHHAGALLGQPGAAGGQPRPHRGGGGGASGALPLRGDPPLRPLRAADDGGLQRPSQPPAL